MRGWADHLVAAGYTVRLPLLPGPRHPLAGREPDDVRRLAGDRHGEPAELTAPCRAVVVGGLSMGGTLTLRLAELHPDAIAGIVLVNPSILTLRKEMTVLPVLKYLVPVAQGHRRATSPTRTPWSWGTPGPR